MNEERRRAWKAEQAAAIARVSIDLARVVVRLASTDRLHLLPTMRELASARIDVIKEQAPPWLEARMFPPRANPAANREPDNIG